MLVILIFLSHRGSEGCPPLVKYHGRGQAKTKSHRAAFGSDECPAGDTLQL